MTAIRTIVRRLAVFRLSYAVFMWLGLVLLAFNTLYGILFSLKWGVFHDAQIYYYTGRKVLEGQAPYRDFFMMDMPATYLIYALGQWLFGISDLSHRMFDLAWTGFITAAIISICRRESLLAAISAALFYTCLHISQGSDQMLQRDFLMVPFMLFAAHLAASFLEGRRLSHCLFLCGLCIGIAAFIKPTALVLAPLLLLVIATHPAGTLKALLSCCLYAGLGMAAAALPILLWLWLAGGLPAWWDMLIHFLPVYDTIGPLPGTVFDVQDVAAMLFTMAMASIYSPAHLRTRNYVLLAGYITGLINFYVQPFGYIFRWCPTYAFFIAFSFFNLRSFFNAGGAFPKLVVVVSAFTLYAFFSPLDYLSRAALNSEWDVQRNAREALGNDVKLAQESLAPELRSAENQNTMHFFEIIGDFWYTATRLKTRSPSRCFSSIIFYLFNDNPYVQRLRKECVRELEAAPPDIIGVNGTDYARWQKEMDFAETPEMAAFIAGHYTLFPHDPAHTTSMGDAYKIYVRKTALPQEGQESDPRSYYFYNASALPTEIAAPDGWELEAKGPTQGLLNYGPYINVPPGVYTLTIKYYTPGGNTKDVVGWWAAGYYDNPDKPDVTLAWGDLNSTANPGGATLETQFEVPNDDTAKGLLQIQTFYYANGALSLRSIEFSGPQ